MTKKLTLKASMDDQRFVLDNRFDVAIPVCLVETQDELYAECYPIVRRTLRLHVSRYEGRLFSRDSLADLQSAVLPLLAPYGYEDDCHRNRVYRIYRANTKEAPMPSDDGVHMFVYGGETPYRNKTTLHLEDGLARGCLAVCIEIGGEIVSAVQTHGAIDENTRLAEVTVETAPAARGKGYATRALLEMSRLLAKRFIVMEYRVSERNRASITCAERAGLVHIGHAYYYVLRYRKEKDRNGL